MDASSGCAQTTIRRPALPFRDLHRDARDGLFRVDPLVPRRFRGVMAALERVDDLLVRHRDPFPGAAIVTGP